MPRQACRGRPTARAASAASAILLERCGWQTVASFVTKKNALLLAPRHTRAHLLVGTVLPRSSTIGNRRAGGSEFGSSSTGEGGAMRSSEEMTAACAPRLPPALRVRGVLALLGLGLAPVRGDGQAAAVRRLASRRSAECRVLHSFSTSTTSSIFLSANPDAVRSCCTVSAGR